MVHGRCLRLKKNEQFQRDRKSKEQYIDVTAKAIKKAIKSVAQGKSCCKTSQICLHFIAVYPQYI